MAVVSEPSLELHGEVIEPDDPGYDEARKVYNGMIDKRPAAIARCADQGDVIQAIRYGRERGLDIAIRGGGHNGGGLGTVDDGLVIDLSGIRGVHVDPKTATVRVAGGSLLRDVDHATAAFGLAVPAGVIGTTGAGGLTLGNLLSADVVLADGSVVTASEDEHPDLFWALRGGGGNFGVVTSFTFRGHPGRHRRRGPDALVARPVCRDPPGVPRVHPVGAPRAERVLRVPDGPTGTAVSGGAASAEDVRSHLVLQRPCERGRRGAGARTRLGAGRPRRRAADAAADAAGRVRRPLPARRSVVLAGGLRHGDPGRGGRAERRVRREAADLEV